MAIETPPDLEDATAEEVLAHVAERFHPRLYVACSFQKEASVIMDMLLKIEPEARFFTLDTGFLFDETHATWEQLESHYDIEVDVYKGITVDEQRDQQRRPDPGRVVAAEQSGVAEERAAGHRSATDPRRRSAPTRAAYQAMPAARVPTSSPAPTSSATASTARLVPIVG